MAGYWHVRTEEAAFIDYEYGCYAFRGFDLGNHYNEFASFDCDYSKYPDKDFQLQWFDWYLTEYNGGMYFTAQEMIIRLKVVFFSQTFTGRIGASLQGSRRLFISIALLLGNLGTYPGQSIWHWLWLHELRRSSFRWIWKTEVYCILFLRLVT